MKGFYLFKQMHIGAVPEMKGPAPLLPSLSPVPSPKAAPFLGTPAQKGLKVFLSDGVF